MGFFGKLFGGNSAEQAPANMEVVKSSDADQAEAELDKEMDEYFEEKEAELSHVEAPADDLKFEDLGKEEEEEKPAEAA